MVEVAYCGFHQTGIILEALSFVNYLSNSIFKTKPKQPRTTTLLKIDLSLQVSTAGRDKSNNALNKGDESLLMSFTRVVSTSYAVGFMGIGE